MIQHIVNNSVQFSSTNASNLFSVSDFFCFIKNLIQSSATSKGKVA